MRLVIFPLSEWDTDYRKLSKQWHNATVMTKLNQQLYDNLTHCISLVLKYAKDHNIVLQNNDNLFKSMDESKRIMDRISQFHDQPTGNTDNNYRRGNSTLKQVLSGYRDMDMKYEFFLN